MALPNVIINLANGALGRVAATADGVAGLILTGAAVEGKLDLNKVYQLSSPLDLDTLGITADNNPLVYKEVVAFYTALKGSGELYLLVVSEATTLSQMVAVTAASPARTIVDYAGGRIRLLGVNKNPPNSYTATVTQGIDSDAITAAAAAQSVAESYTGEIWPFRILLPAIGWTGTTENLFSPRGGSYNRVAYVLASDGKFGAGQFNSAAIGQTLGRAAKIAVNQSIARVKDGAIAPSGFLTDGSKPEVKAGLWDALNDAGYIFYRTFTGKEGYFFNDDHTAAPISDDYGNLNLGRVIDKAIIQAYLAYIDEINDNIMLNDDGTIDEGLCRYFKQKIENAVAITMNGEISSFNASIDPAQNVLSSSEMEIVCEIVPTATLRKITVKLGFKNPALKS